MSLEWSVFGAYFPALLGLLFISLVLMWVCDRLLSRLGVYRYVWHPALFRLSLCVCLFGAVVLTVYKGGLL